MYRNLVYLQGRLGADADFKTFDDGGTRANMRVATTKKWRNKSGETVERTQWHNVALRLSTEAQIAFFKDRLTKGAEIDVEGELTYREYTKDGEIRYITEILADRIQPISNAASTSGAGSSSTAGQNDGADEGSDEPSKVVW